LIECMVHLPGHNSHLLYFNIFLSVCISDTKRINHISMHAYNVL
jgi:hypothetical protein